MQKLIGIVPILHDHGQILNMSLGSINPMVHPAIMYSKWRDWTGEPLNEKPSFYHGITEEAADLVSAICDEIISISKLIEQQTKIKLDVPHIYDWFLAAYSKVCDDTSSLFKGITTSHTHKNAVHPMIQCDENKEEYIPNFKFRYLTEDIPFGLVVVRGLSLILNEEYKQKVNAPQMDKVIKWAQKILNKEYFIYNEDGTIVAGKDINQTRAPQRYHIKCIHDLVDTL